MNLRAALLLPALLGAATATAFDVPASQGYVTDTAEKLTAEDRSFLDGRLRRFEEATGSQVVVLLAGSLQDETVDDVAYATFRAWKIGQRGKDNGVLLVIAPTERKVRIETGKGVGGDLTDLQSNDIIRRRIAPLLRENRFRDAIQAGTDAIMVAASGGQYAPEDRAGSPRPRAEQVPGAQPPVAISSRLSGCLCLIVGLVVFLSLFRRRRGFFWGGPFIGGGGWGGWGGGGGGGWGGGGGGGGGDGGGGFSGGGGESGGGGSSDSY